MSRLGAFNKESHMVFEVKVTNIVFFSLLVSHVVQLIKYRFTFLIEVMDQFQCLFHLDDVSW